jgi:hypothetical protein
VLITDTKITERITEVTLANGTKTSGTSLAKLELTTRVQFPSEEAARGAMSTVTGSTWASSVSSHSSCRDTHAAFSHS